MCRDRVLYAHWGTGLGERLLVRPNLERIFAFRRRAILGVFGGDAGRESCEGRGALEPVGVCVCRGCSATPALRVGVPPDRAL